MFIERVTKHARTFDTEDVQDNKDYCAVLNDPAVRVLVKRFIKHTEVEAQGRDRTEQTRDYVYMEWEECSL
jgi:hypothetical protein